MSYCDNPKCSQPRVKRLNKAHNYLCLKSKHYHNWHHYKHHKKVHFGVLGIYFALIVGLLINIIYISPRSALAATGSWNFSVAGDYTASSGAEVSTSAHLNLNSYAKDSNTMGLWHFDDNANDSSDNANTGTLTGGSYAAAKYNNGLSLDGVNDDVTVSDSASLSLTGSNTIEGWTKFNSTFDSTTNARDTRQYIADKGNYQLYYDNTTGKINYELEPTTAKSWSQVAGNDIGGSWDYDGKLVVSSVIDPLDNTKMYVGTGAGVGDAEVWKYDGSSWKQLGRPGTDNIWVDNNYRSVNTLAMVGSTALYAGLGDYTNDAEVWRCDPTVDPPVWTKIGGDGVNNSWLNSASVSRVRALEVIGTTIYAGIGTLGGGGTVNYGQVWSWNGSTWTKIAGSGTNNGWVDGDGNDEVLCLETDGTDLYAGVGKYGTAGKGKIWKFTVASNSWGGAAIGGDGTGAPWPAADHEETKSLFWDGSSLYAGMGSSAGDGDVYKYNGGAWTLFAGDGTGWAGAQYERVWSMAAIGSDLYFALGDTNADGRIFKYTADGGTWSTFAGNGTGFSVGAIYSIAVYGAGNNVFAATSDTKGYLYTSSWAMIGGNYINKSWGFYSVYGLRSVNCLTSHNGKLYAGNGNAEVANGGGEAQVWEYNGSTWTMIGGQGINSSWTADTHRGVMSMASFKGNLYVGLGWSSSAEVWKWNGSGWSEVGGDGLNEGWDVGSVTHDAARSMAVLGDYLYVGLGDGGSDAEVWRWNGTTWGTNPIGGDSQNSGWTTGYDTVYSLTAYKGNLYAGLSNTGGEAEIWKWNGSSWSGAAIGGDGINNSWDSGTTNYEQVRSLAVYNNKLYAGLGSTTGDAEIWAWDGTTWGSAPIGGDGVNSSWTDEYEAIYSITVYNGELYAGLGNSQSQDAEVYKYNGSIWTKIGGDGLDNSWTIRDMIYGITVFNGSLYVAIGSINTSSGSSSAAIYKYGQNAVLTSTTSSFDTNWHHIAASYDGSTMKIYIDGVEDASLAAGGSITDKSLPLLFGTSYGNAGAGLGEGFFAGLIDEIRISNIARTSFNTTSYPITRQTVTLKSAFKTSGVKSWDGFSATSSGVTVTFRLTDSGADESSGTWKYWVDNAWVASSSLSQANSAADIDTHISTFPITNSGIKWQAVLLSNGTDQVSLTDITIEYTADDSAPDNPNTVSALSEEGSETELTSGEWYDFAAPYFSWSGASDGSGSGIAGYYVYWGTSSTGTPTEYQTAATYEPIGLSSGSTYYLRIKTRDNAFNPAATVWDAFTYKYNSGGNAPTQPLNLTHQKCISENETPNCTGGASSSESPATINRFSFSWDPPETYVNGITKYRYSINVEPTEANTNITTNEYLQADSFATQQGKNTLYVVAQDNQGAISYSNYGEIDFYAETAAPGAPESMAVTDTSNRTASQYRLTVTWSLPSTGSTPIDYEIFRSQDNSSYSSIGTTISTGYLDSGLTTGTTYYYKVKSRDDAGSASAFSGLVSKDPTGKYSEPPTVISAPIATAGANYVKVAWETSRSAEGIVECGTTLNYGISGLSLEPSTHHEVTVSGLNPDTSYNFRVQSLDPGEFRDYSSTEGKSANYQFRTQPAPGMSDVSFSDITTNSAILSFSTTKASTSRIDYGTRTDGVYDQYVTDQSLGGTTKHLIRFANLTDGTKYQVKITIDDSDGNSVSSMGHSFTTNAKPAISSFQLQPIADAASTTYDVIWSTNVPTSSNVVFSSSKGHITESKADLETQHSLRVKNLLDQATYTIIASGRDQYGNECTYMASSVTTPVDTRSPKISNMIVEVKSSGFGETQKAQIIVSWETDEPATSQVEYAQGMSGTEYTNISKEDLAHSTSHVVILSELEPSKIYHLRALSRDMGGNRGYSEDTTTITGKIQDSVLDIIMNSLTQSLGWIFGIFS